MTMIQIYFGPASQQDLFLCVEAGADFIGMAADKRLIEDKAYTGGTLPSQEEIGELFASLPSDIMTVALSFENDIFAIIEMANIVKPKAIHLAGKTPLAVENIAALKMRMPEIKIMQSIPMNKDDPIKMAIQYQNFCDYFLLDSKGSEKDHPYGVGATGETHDWNLSAELVRKVKIPVILAGGLNADNVSRAIEIVKPWAVDSFTQTNQKPIQNSFKDIEKVKQFIENTRN